MRLQAVLALSCAVNGTRGENNLLASFYAKKPRRLFTCFFCFSQDGPYVYELFSIMVHSGSAAGGHYYAYVKSFENGRWYSFNDQVKRVLFKTPTIPSVLVVRASVEKVRQDTEKNCLPGCPVKHHSTISGLPSKGCWPNCNSVWSHAKGELSYISRGLWICG